MAIEESKIINLIASYEKYKEECQDSLNMVDFSRARLYRAVISDLEELLPRKSLADLDVSNYGELTGTIVEYARMKGVLLGGGSDVVTLFTFADKCVVYTYPSSVFPLDEDRVWDKTGTIL